MNNLTKLTIALSGALIASAVLLLKYQQQAPGTHMLTIGILQTASHPALDAARDGFITTMEKELNENVQFIIRNAEGSIPAAHTIAQNFKAHNVDGIFAIATPAAQAVASQEKTKPIVIAAVTDPEAAGVCNTNVFGCTDHISIAETIDLLRELIPQARTVAIIANSGEVNSHVQAQEMQAILIARGLKPLVIGITSEADIAAAVLSACQKADVLLVPNDNIVGSSIQLVASLALKNKRAVIACANTFVEQGALAARGVDYYATGVHAAHQALQVLAKGITPEKTAITHPREGNITINTKVADALALKIPDALRKNSTLIKG